MSGRMMGKSWGSYHIMAGCAFVVAKELCYHNNLDDFILWELSNSFYLSSTELIHMCTLWQLELEQLERLRSEIPPTATWLHILVIHIRSQGKTRQSQSYKFKKIAKNLNFEILQETLHTTHLLKWLDKIKIWNWSNQNYRCYRADTGCGTDGWTDGVKPIYPPTTLYNY